LGSTRDARHAGIQQATAATENGGVRADAQGQRQDGDGREGRGAEQAPDGVAEVLAKIVERHRDRGAAADARDIRRSG
jgi:hypothetical protein